MLYVRHWKVQPGQTSLYECVVPTTETAALSQPPCSKTRGQDQRLPASSQNTLASVKSSKRVPRQPQALSYIALDKLKTIRQWTKTHWHLQQINHSIVHS